MKKRLRKKLHVGEFADLRFTLTGKVTGVTEADADDFYTELFQAVAEFGCCLNGTVGTEAFDLEVITGPVNTDNDARKDALVAALKANSHVAEVNASELSL